jgi:hypothetical protein
MTERKGQPKTAQVLTGEDADLFHEIRRMIEEMRSTIAATVNAVLTLLYWRVGKRIQEEILHSKRARFPGI